MIGHEIDRELVARTFGRILCWVFTCATLVAIVSLAVLWEAI